MTTIPMIPTTITRRKMITKANSKTTTTSMRKTNITTANTTLKTLWMIVTKSPIQPKTTSQVTTIAAKVAQNEVRPPKVMLPTAKKTIILMMKKNQAIKNPVIKRQVMTKSLESEDLDDSAEGWRS